MKRRTFDVLVSAAGILLALVLVVSAGLLTWANHFVGNEVHTQLAAQKIFFPAKGSPATAGPQFADMRQYAGQQLTTGAQAKVYADDFIAIHLSEAGGGKTYAQLSTAAQAAPNDVKLQAQVATMFKGETLRGLLLNAYAFGTMGTIAGIAAIAAFVAAGLMALLGAFGFVHARRTQPETEVLGGHVKSPEPVTV